MKTQSLCIAVSLFFFLTACDIESTVETIRNRPEPKINAEELHRQGKNAFNQENYEEAARLWEQACKRGVAKSCAGLATLYIDGKGVEENHTLAKTLSEQACDKGSASGCALLGLAYADGYIIDSVEEDVAYAKQLSKQACNGNEMEEPAGVAGGCALMGVLVLTNGNLYSHREPNEAYAPQAIPLFEKSCTIAENIDKTDMGQIRMMNDFSAGTGCSLLGALYFSGKGVRQNDTLAQEYFGKACDLGQEAACDLYRNYNRNALVRDFVDLFR